MPSRSQDAPAGESALLARMLPLLGEDPRTEVGPGDDAAVLRLDSPRLVITTDTLVEGYDFLRTATTAHWVGRKAAVQNLADVAAMGARPQALVVALSMPRDEAPWVAEQLTAGCAEQARSLGVHVVGGDLGEADRLTVTVTAVGSLREGAAPIRRDGARAGDVLAVGAPALGRSAAGLALALSGRVRVPFDGGDRPVVEIEDALRAVDGEAPVALLRHHDAPDPDLALGWTRGRGAPAMLDLSDGLVRDGGRLAAASGLVLDLDPEALGPDIAALAPLAAALGADAQEWVLHGGEEHAMLAAFPPAAVPEGFRPIGRLSVPDGAHPAGTVMQGGEPVAGEGFDHFA